ncbi:MAG: D-alanyl-D-alanine carboxypeptidase family protein [Proteobacteria bacterium]|nr:MAG: D-alanyl-D-alanine carboxypeptidase family protein [Pseudomonadota bacterium]
MVSGSFEVSELSAELKIYYARLRITDADLDEYPLPFCEQAKLDELEVVDLDFAGRPFVLTSRAAEAWRNLVAAASFDDVRIMPASGFRSYLYQQKLIEKRLAEGEALDGVLMSNVLPGFSEHHTGQAVDICSEPMVGEDRFQETDAFAWMTANGHSFGFTLSYPANNGQGLIFEPWHWLFGPKPTFSAR